jgi:hypothetical protein
MASRSRREKPKPNQPDGWNVPLVTQPAVQSFEDVLYQALRDSFGRSDAAARAVARLDYQLVLQQNQEEAGAGVTPTKEGGAALLRSSGVFDDREFVETFERLSFLRLVMDLLKVLDLQELRTELITALIDDRFRPKSVATGRAAAPEAATVQGSDMAVLVNNIKRLAERKARTEPRPTRAAAK